MKNTGFCIPWKNFPSYLTSTFKDLLVGGDFTDVTLVSDEQIQLQAHKIVLSACSPVLKNILMNAEHPKPIIYLKGFEKKELDSILQFMYLGEALVHQDRINEFMEKAKDLEVKELITELGSESEKNLPNGLDDLFSADEDQTSDNNIYTIQKDNDCTKKEIEEADISVDKNLAMADDSNNKSNEGFYCNKCEYWTKWKQLIQRHNLSKHEGISFQCEECDSIYVDKNSLAKHIRSKHEGVTYDCDKCGFVSSNRSTIKRHKVAIHNEGSKYQCNQCDHQATTSQLLKLHREVKHEGITYSCNICDFRALRKDHLNIHLQSKHEGVKYPCTQCNFESLYPSGLSAHKRKQHKGNFT